MRSLQTLHDRAIHGGTDERASGISTHSAADAS